MLKLGLLLLCLFGFAFSQSKPLIMDHADSLYVDRTHGYLVLHGNVKFHHDSIQFSTQHATWNKSADLVRCENGFLFLHPKGSMHAKAGEYSRKDQKAEAMGNVVARDSSGEGTYFGEHMIYDRKNDFLDLISAPKLQRYEKDTVKHTIDTLTIVARRITYDRKKDFATAYGNVKITRGDLIVTCDTGWFDRKHNHLAMIGKPKCLLKENQLLGDSMYLELDVKGEKLKQVQVVRHAQGIQDEKPANGDPLKHTQVQGDTLFANFDNDKMKDLTVNRNAHGEFWEEDLKSYVNKMSGTNLHLDFDDGKMKLAKVLGTAKSTYWYTDKDRKISGRNEAMGDSIFVTFDSSKVKRLRMLGKLASGVFYDLSKKNDTTKTSSGSSSKTSPLGNSLKKAMDRKNKSSSMSSSNSSTLAPQSSAVKSSTSVATLGAASSVTTATSSSGVKK